MSIYEFVSSRISDILQLRISAAHKLEKLEKINLAIDRYKKGMITEEELIYLIG